ncbi:peptidase domain-containing ABC transporter [Niabella aquatica]
MPLNKMQPKQQKNIRKTFALQHDQSDCGVACLLSLIKYYSGNNTLENLRHLSGTNTTGTTLLGLYHAANAVGFTAEGCEADINALAEHGKPCILHVTINDNMQHYIVCYGLKSLSGRGGGGGEAFLIGDPAQGIVHYSKNELDKIWQSKACLTLEPNEKFIKAADEKKAKISWIKNLVKEDAPMLGIAAFLGVAVAALGLVMAVFSQRLIDDVLPNKDYEKLYIGIVLVFLLLLVKEGLSVLRQHFLIKQARGFNLRIVSFFFGHLLQLPKPFFDSRKIGDMTARLNDTSRIQRVISQLAGNIMIDILAVIVSMVFVFTYSATAGLICLLTLPLLFLLVYKNNHAIIGRQKNVMQGYAGAEANYISTLQGIEAVKTGNHQEAFNAANNTVYQKYQDAVFNLGSFQIRLSFIINVSGLVFLTGILAYCCYAVLNNELKTGALIAILSMCGTMLPAVANLALIMIPVNEAKIAFDRMFEFTNSKPEDAAGIVLNGSFQSVSIKNLSFRFPGRRPLLKSIGFTVNKGEIIALMGENGCGKSTLSQLLLKNYDYECGDILVNGKISLKQVNIQSWRNLISVVPQEPHIFNTTILENIAFEDAAKRTGEVLQFLQRYGFASFIDGLPQSFMTVVGKGGINLSGGQKQMIALARALYKMPQLLILDEATAAMDRTGEQFVLQLLMRLKPQMGIIFITHRLHVLKSFCDRICLLENGIITASGSHDCLIEQDNLYSRYWQDML